jgi:hypothetical protein
MTKENAVKAIEVLTNLLEMYRNSADRTFYTLIENKISDIIKIHL